MQVVSTLFTLELPYCWDLACCFFHPHGVLNVRHSRHSVAKTLATVTVASCPEPIDRLAQELLDVYCILSLFGSGCFKVPQTEGNQNRQNPSPQLVKCYLKWPMFAVCQILSDLVFMFWQRGNPFLGAAVLNICCTQWT